eukprot:3529865-Prymnesium_polylepis.1
MLAPRIASACPPPRERSERHSLKRSFCIAAMRRQRSFDRARLQALAPIPLAGHEICSPRSGEGRPKAPSVATLTSPLPLLIRESESADRVDPAARRVRRPREASMYIGSMWTSLALFNVRLSPIGDAGTTRWYLVHLVCRLRPKVSWTVRRRYANFACLVRALSTVYPSSAIPTLPPKLMLKTAAEQQRRTLGLQLFCEQCLADQKLLPEPIVSKVSQQPSLKLAPGHASLIFVPTTCQNPIHA